MEELKNINKQLLLEKELLKNHLKNVNGLDQKHKEVENEQLLALHFNQTPLGVIEWDLNFCVKKWNNAASKIFGYHEKDAIGKRANFIVPDSGLEQIEEVWSNLLAFKGGKKSINQNITQTGKMILCEWYNTPLVNEDGKVIAVASLVQDISERVRTEQMQKVLYNISNAVNTSDNLKSPCFTADSS